MPSGLHVIPPGTSLYGRKCVSYSRPGVCSTECVTQWIWVCAAAALKDNICLVLGESLKFSPASSSLQPPAPFVLLRQRSFVFFVQFLFYIGSIPSLPLEVQKQPHLVVVHGLLHCDTRYPMPQMSNAPVWSGAEAPNGPRLHALWSICFPVPILLWKSHCGNSCDQFLLASVLSLFLNFYPHCFNVCVCVHLCVGPNMLVGLPESTLLSCSSVSTHSASVSTGSTF